MIQINFKWILALISTLIPKTTQSELNIPVSQKYHNKYCETSISILVSRYCISSIIEYIYPNKCRNVDVDI